MEKFSEKIKSTGKKITMGAGIIASSLNATPTFANSNIENKKEYTISIDKDQEKDVSSAEDTYLYDASFDNGDEGAQLESKETYEIDFAQYFEMGSAEIKESDKEAIMQKLEGFLESLPEDVVERLKNGESAISVYASCSPELIPEDYTTGQYKIRKSDPENPNSGGNNDLGAARGNEMATVILEVLSDHELSGAQIEIEVAKGGVDADGKRKVEVSFTDIALEDVTQKHEEVVTSKTFGVIFDYSGSMLARTNQLKEDIKSFNKGDDGTIETFMLQGGNMEVHLITLRSVLMRENVVNNDEATKRLYLVTDELDTSLGAKVSNEKKAADYRAMMQEVLDLAKEKNIEIVINFYHPDMQKMEYKEIVLGPDNMDVLLPGVVSGNSDLGIYNNMQ